MPAYAPGQTTGYTSISDYLDANQGTVAGDIAALQAQANAQLDNAKAAADQYVSRVTPGSDPSGLQGYLDVSGQLQDAVNRAQNLNDRGVIANQLEENYYPTGSQAPNVPNAPANFDANLVYAQPGNPFGAVADRAKSLSNYLDDNAAKAAIVPLPDVQLDPGDGTGGSAGDHRHNRPHPDDTPPPPPPDNSADATPWIDPDHTDPNGGPAYLNPWGQDGGG